MTPTTGHATLPDARVQHAAYRHGLTWLYGLSPNVRTAAEIVADQPRKLPRMRALLGRLGNPEDEFSAVLVAGTKGKGSTAAMLDALVRAAGTATGLYTQPHLVSWCERTRLGGRAIRPEEAAALMPAVRVAVESLERDQPELGAVTTFEAGTALTFLAFAELGVRLAVVEVGVGGAHDATNVLEPAVAVLTSISLDHTATLGPTLAQIAEEKAGIFRPGGRAVVGPQGPEALAVVERIAAERGTDLEVVGRDWHWFPTDTAPATGRFSIVGPNLRLDDLELGLVGRHQRENATLAVAAAWALRVGSPSATPSPNPLPPGERALALSPGGRGPSGRGLGRGEGEIRHALATVEWPGRFQVLREQPWVVVDGAHNDDSARRLAETYRDVFGDRRCHLVFGASAGKDAAGMLDVLLPLAATVILTRSRHERAAPLDGLTAALGHHRAELAAEATVADAIRRALAGAGPNDVVLVTGSLFVVGEAIEVSP